MKQLKPGDRPDSGVYPARIHGVGTVSRSSGIRDLQLPYHPGLCRLTALQGRRTLNATSVQHRRDPLPRKSFTER